MSGYSRIDDFTVRYILNKMFSKLIDVLQIDLHEGFFYSLFISMYSYGYEDI